MKHAATAPPAPQLSVDWTRCEGHGLCAALAPELIALDPWGFPLVTDDVPADQADLARRATRICPATALRLAPRE